MRSKHDAALLLTRKALPDLVGWAIHLLIYPPKVAISTLVNSLNGVFQPAVARA
jgi:hypothetical protein